MEKNPVDIKSFNLHKSHTFSSFTHSSSHKISSWFTAVNERRKKSAMKSNKNLTLAVLHENPLPSNSVITEPEKIEDKHSPVKLRNKSKRIAETNALSGDSSELCQINQSTSCLRNGDFRGSKRKHC